MKSNKLDFKIILIVLFHVKFINYDKFKINRKNILIKLIE